MKPIRRSLNGLLTGAILLFPITLGRTASAGAATTKIQDELERRRWRLRHGRSNVVDVRIERLKKSISTFVRYRPKGAMCDAPTKLWKMLHEMKRYPPSNANIIVNDISPSALRTARLYFVSGIGRQLLHGITWSTLAIS